MKTLSFVQNLVFSFLTYVIILLFPPIYMVIEHSFMNKSYTAKIYIYIYIGVLYDRVLNTALVEQEAYLEPSGISTMQLICENK